MEFEGRGAEEWRIGGWWGGSVSNDREKNGQVVPGWRKG